MKVKDLISKLQKIEKTTSGEVSFKLASPNWAEGDILYELNLVLLENAGDVFTEIIFENQQASRRDNMTKKHEVTITWGTEAVRGIEKPIKGYTKIKYKFNTESELDAFIKGVDEGNGWLEYEVQE